MRTSHPSPILRINLAAVAIVSMAVAASAEEPPLANGMPLYFEEDFENGHDRWTMTDPKAWALVDDHDRKVLALERSSEYQPPVRSPLSIALIKHLNVGSFVLEARVKQTGREYGHRDLCFFFGHQGVSTFYYVHIATEADPNAHSIFLVNKAPRTSVAEERTEGAKWDDKYHTVRIERDIESGLIEVFLDDMSKPIMRTHDKTFTRGTIGVGSFDDQGYFDRIRIWANPDKD